MLGGLYALISLGYALVLGVLGVFNLAHAEIFMVGAVLGWMAMTQLHLSLGVAILMVVAGGVVLGLMTEIFCVRRPITVGSIFIPVATTLGFGMILISLVENVAGVNPLPISVPLQFIQVHFGSTSIPLLNIIVLLGCLAVLGMLVYYLGRTRLGLATRAVGENREVSELCGINPNRIIQITFAISGVMGTVSGLMFGIMVGAAHPYIGEVAGLKGLCLVIIGGMGSIPGAVIAGLIGGIAEVLTSVYWSVKYADGVLWVIMFIILLVRPLGLMGKAEELERLQ